MSKNDVDYINIGSVFATIGYANKDGGWYHSLVFFLRVPYVM